MSCSSRENILKFDKAVPRYTSYPTAPHFKKSDTLNDTYPVIPGEDPISLYIHVPFCPKMCWYCGCHTKITKKYDPVKSYAEHVLKEIELINKHQGRNLPVSHIHFGGGSPGMLSPEDFTAIMNALHNRFNIVDDAEIAIEIDPREITEDKIVAYAKTGINRVSLGSQDFNDDVLDAVNRQQPFSLSQNAINLFRKHGINQFNIDLIYGLPHQSADKMKNTINLALTLDPDRVSLFGYAHVPWMKKHMRLIDENALPDKELRLDLFETGAKMLEDNGYVAIGIDHFTKPDDTMATAFKNKELRRNFQGYTTDQSNIMLGIGASSIGKTNEGYFQNHPDMPLYTKAIDENKLPLAKFCPITETDKIRGQIIERIMCDFEIDLANYPGDYTTQIQSLKHYEDEGILTINETTIKIDYNARPIARIIASIFDEYLPASFENKHSKAI